MHVCTDGRALNFVNDVCDRQQDSGRRGGAEHGQVDVLAVIVYVVQYFSLCAADKVTGFRILVTAELCSLSSA